MPAFQHRRLTRCPLARRRERGSYARRRFVPPGQFFRRLSPFIRNTRMGAVLSTAASCEQSSEGGLLYRRRRPASDVHPGKHSIYAVQAIGHGARNPSATLGSTRRSPSVVLTCRKAQPIICRNSGAPPARASARLTVLNLTVSIPGMRRKRGQKGNPYKSNLGKCAVINPFAAAVFRERFVPPCWPGKIRRPARTLEERSTLTSNENTYARLLFSIFFRSPKREINGCWFRLASRTYPW
jgi:hypothetical protein